MLNLQCFIYTDFCEGNSGERSELIGCSLIDITDIWDKKQPSCFNINIINESVKQVGELPNFGQAS